MSDGSSRDKDGTVPVPQKPDSNDPGKDMLRLKRDQDFVKAPKYQHQGGAYHHLDSPRNKQAADHG